MATIRVESKLGVPILLHRDYLLEVEPGVLEARRIGNPVELRPGINEIDATFWNGWREQHRGTRLSEHFLVVEKEPESEQESDLDPLPASSPWASGLTE